MYPKHLKELVSIVKWWMVMFRKLRLSTENLIIERCRIVCGRSHMFCKTL